MRIRGRIELGWPLCAVLLLGACARRPQASPAVRLTVAAAANLSSVFGEVGGAFTKKTGVEVVYSYGSTAQLAQQIGHGAPFDLFASADTQHVDALVKAGKLVAGSRAIYARGELALWVPKGGVRELKDLTNPGIRFIAIAQPELAPYGQAAVEALKSAGLWDALQPKFVYANSISIAKQLADSGNADAAFTAYSLVLHASGTVLKVDSRLYRPIDQALAIVSASPRAGEAQQFKAFLLGPDGRSILGKSGYLLP
jgi:molybdate transport system substrate-binding protein